MGKSFCFLHKIFDAWNKFRLKVQVHTLFRRQIFVLNSKSHFKNLNFQSTTPKKLQEVDVSEHFLMNL